MTSLIKNLGYTLPEDNLVKAAVDSMRDCGTPVHIVALFSDRPRSGKDTVAAPMLELFKNFYPQKLAFATALRREVQLTFAHQYVYNSDTKKSEPFERFSNSSMKDVPLQGLSVEAVSAYEYKKFLTEKMGLALDTPLSARKHLQMYGNDFVKDYLGKPDYWVGRMAQELYYKIIFNNCKFIAITDMRDPLEYAFLKNIGAKFVKVNRSGFPDDGYSFDSAHAIEKHAPTFEADVTINNQYEDLAGTRYSIIHTIGGLFPHISLMSN